MWKFVTAVLLIAAVTAAGFSLIDGGSNEVTASAVIIASATNLDDFERAIEPREWSFPRDYGSHDRFQTEWWYYTGSLKTAEGRRFGYQFTIFRRAISPDQPESESEWRSNQIYMAHFTVSDLENAGFYHDERYSRGGAELAGSFPNDQAPEIEYRVFLENWDVYAAAPTHRLYHLHAESDQGFAVKLALHQVKPPVLQGDNGLSVKGDEPGNASYYYSLPRLDTEGRLTVDGQEFEVTGTTWMDHEFSTGALDADAVGWDWFGLHFDDGRDLMVGRLRLTGDEGERAYGASLVEADGTAHYLDYEDFQIVARDQWTSPHTGATYPSGWTITLNADAIGAEDDLVFNVLPLQPDQELHSGDIIYWEGAVELTGDVTGFGYTELTGYATKLTGRF